MAVWLPLDSGHSARRDETIAAIAARILENAPERFAVLGTSMGGYVALEVIRQAPDRVAGLGLVSTSARADTPEQVAAREDQSHLVERGGFNALVDAAFRGVVAERNEDDLELLKVWRAMAGAIGPEAFLRQQRAVIDRIDSRDSLSAISCPTTIIHGVEDRLIPIDVARETASAIPAAYFTAIETAGHFLFHEQPEAAAHAVAAFLDRADTIS